MGKQTLGKSKKKGLDVSSLENLSMKKYDYVVIAVEKEDMAQEIREELIRFGVQETKILWRSPIYITDL